MKQIVTLFVLALAALTIHAQKKSLLDYQKIQLGTYANGKPFLCHFVLTDEELKFFGFTKDQPLLLIGDKHGNKLFNTNTFEEIAEPDFKNKRFSQVIQEGYLVFTPMRAFSFSYGQPSFFNLNGEKIWSSKETLILTDRSEKVVICGKNHNDDKLIAYDMPTGKVLWQKTIPGSKHYLWADVNIDQENSRYYYLMGDSLYRLNVLTGDTLRHTFAASVKEPMKSVFSIAKVRTTLPSRDFMKEAIFSGGVGATLTGTHSNLIFSGDSLLIADADHLYCLDKNLKAIWTADFPAQSGAKSRIKIMGDKICMQNFGVGFQNGLVGRYGLPFTATFDRKTGKQLSLVFVDIKKKIMGGLMIDGRTYWQTDKEFLYNELGDSTVHEIKWKPTTTQLPQEDYPDFVLCDTVGIVKDGTFEYVATDKHQLVVEVYGQDVNVIKADGSCQLIPADSVFLHDTGNVYSTNNSGDVANTFIVVDPKTRKVEVSFHLKGRVYQDDSGNIYVRIKQGVGFHKRE